MRNRSPQEPPGLENGTAEPASSEKPKTSKRKKRNPKAAPEPSANGQDSKHEEPQRWRLAYDVKEGKVEWLIHPWIPKRMLTVVVGPTGVGKSTVLSWIVSQAGSAVMLPGHEESVEILTKPRLRANGANEKEIRFLDIGSFALPRDKKYIAGVVKKFGAKVVTFDPLDNYLEEGKNENLSADVREMLEAAQWIGEETGAAIVGVRHPGKAMGNLMRGSQAWGSVPRVIVELARDTGSSDRFIIRHHKDATGQNAGSRYYSLVGEPGNAKRFQLGDALDQAQDDMARSQIEGIERAGRVDACVAIYHLFNGDEGPAVEDVVKRCREEGISDRARFEAVSILKLGRKTIEGTKKSRYTAPKGGWPPFLLKELKAMGSL